MSLDEVVRLVIESVAVGRTVDVVITKMPAVRIVDLAEVMIRECAPRYGYRPQDIEIKLVGPKPGEKILEELMNEEETRRSYELERYFVVLPAIVPRQRDDASHYTGLVSDAVSVPYNSANASPLSKDDLATFLLNNDLFDT
jgi:FlaA1/EpsC-like NDP-sugar epimerase